ncbi:MAG: hypothetical protein E7Z87_01285 [Cyanobacteria bacterium SIG26]|nr:hypothetical protein [Cyanobacteria bacterium SIG26]
MKRNFIILTLFLTSTLALANEFVPEFANMQTLRCDFEETLYNEDNSIASTSKKFRIYKLDDANKKIYLQKEPIDDIFYYDNDKIEFSARIMTDDSIGRNNILINRQSLKYNAHGQITYDFFGNKYTKSNGNCKIIP